MGDPKKLRKKYSTPSHPWNETSIKNEKELSKEYGLQNKREIYRAISFIKKYRAIAKRLIVDQSSQALKERDQMLTKLGQLGLLQAGANPGDVLGLETKDLLERRLQTIVFRKGLARSIKQARQFITHRHIKVGDKEVTAPSYVVSTAEEVLVKFKGNSSLDDVEHPERAIVTKPNAETKIEAKKEEKAEVKAEEKKEAKETPKTKESPKAKETPKAKEAPKVKETPKAKEAPKAKESSETKEAVTQPEEKKEGEQ